jgi:hypothetical protein
VRALLVLGKRQIAVLLDLTGHGYERLVVTTDKVASREERKTLARAARAKLDLQHEARTRSPS